MWSYIPCDRCVNNNGGIAVVQTWMGVLKSGQYHGVRVPETYGFSK